MPPVCSATNLILFIFPLGTNIQWTELADISFELSTWNAEGTNVWEELGLTMLPSI